MPGSVSRIVSRIESGLCLTCRIEQGSDAGTVCSRGRGALKEVSGPQTPFIYITMFKAWSALDS